MAALRDEYEKKYFNLWILVDKLQRRERMNIFVARILIRKGPLDFEDSFAIHE